MAQRGAVALGARKKCCMQKCKGWEFQGGLCTAHAKQYPAYAEQLALMKDVPVQQANLIVTQSVESPFYLDLVEGDLVDLLDILSDSVTVIVKNQQNNYIGFWHIDLLSTEEDIVANHQNTAVEKQKQAELNAIAAAKAKEQKFEEDMRANMFRKAEADKQRRADDAIQRKLEAERLLKELEEQKVRQEMEALAQAEALRLKKAIAEAQKKEQDRARVEQARIEKQAADELERNRIEQKKMENMPQWKRDLLKRNGN